MYKISKVLFGDQDGCGNTEVELALGVVGVSGFLVLSFLQPSLAQNSSPSLKALPSPSIHFSKGPPIRFIMIAARSMFSAAQRRCFSASARQVGAPVDNWLR